MWRAAVAARKEFRIPAQRARNVPGRIRESGLGDTETNIRWRFQKETEARTEVTFFFKSVFPLQKDKKLLGTQDWEFSPGVVLTKGFSFGTSEAQYSLSKDVVLKMNSGFGLTKNAPSFAPEIGVLFRF